MVIHTDALPQIHDKRMKSGSPRARFSGRCIVSAGHELTAKAALEVMQKGGNAFDGIVAGCFASFVTEAMFTTAAGGGLGVLRFNDGKTICVDFLTNFPTTAMGPEVPKPEKKRIDFGDKTQVFSLGFGSLAVPGTLPGLLYIHDNYGNVELESVLLPAIEYSKGHRLSGTQAFACNLLSPFCLYTPETREIFAPNGKLLKEGDIIRNEKYGNFLKMLGNDKESALRFFYESLAKTLEDNPSTLSVEDVKSYRVFEREPIHLTYKGYDIHLASPPSAGGLLIALALKRLEEKNISRLKHNSAQYIRTIVNAMKQCDLARTREFYEGLLYKRQFWRRFLKISDRLGGTTHISVIDSDGNSTSITNSNGQGAGIAAGDTGIILNNFLGEEDLMECSEIYRPGERITSMMTPTIISKDGELIAVLGSGGSTRIKSAILQVVLNIIEFGMTSSEAVDKSRVHLEEDTLQLELGIDEAVANELRRDFNINRWRKKALFFGGVHTAAPDGGAGDKRRGGAVAMG